MIATKPVDFPKGMDGLAAIVMSEPRLEPFTAIVYVFRSKRADRVKLLFWDGTGVCLLAKRLKGGKVRCPCCGGTLHLIGADTTPRRRLTELSWRRHIHDAMAEPFGR